MIAATGDTGGTHGNSILARFFTSNNQPLRQYRAYRRMHAISEHFNQEGWLEAWTELKDGKFTYQVVSEKGSDTIRTRVLHAVLDREQQMVNSGECDRSELTPANYEFADSGRDRDGAHVVALKPRRHDVLLVEGKAVFSPDGGDLLRVEGRLAKNPSFWTSLVNIVRHYARVGGVRVPVATETTANVRFSGTAELEVVYAYESVNGRPVTAAEQRSALPEHTAAR